MIKIDDLLSWKWFSWEFDFLEIEGQKYFSFGSRRKSRISAHQHSNFSASSLTIALRLESPDCIAEILLQGFKLPAG
jgi:hypothetical protein